MAFMKRHIGAGGTVYCHCNAGKGRSAVVVAAYIISSEFSDWETGTFGDVVKDLRKKRPQVSFGLLDWPFRGQARAVAEFFRRAVHGEISTDSAGDKKLQWQ